MECSHEVTNLKTEGSVSHYKISQEVMTPLAIQGTYFASFHIHQKSNSFLGGGGETESKGRYKLQKRITRIIGCVGKQTSVCFPIPLQADVEGFEYTNITLYVHN
jgi:hypothetical protein